MRVMLWPQPADVSLEICGSPAQRSLAQLQLLHPSGVPLPCTIEDRNCGDCHCHGPSCQGPRFTSTATPALMSGWSKCFQRPHTAHMHGRTDPFKPILCSATTSYNTVCRKTKGNRASGHIRKAQSNPGIGNSALSGRGGQVRPPDFTRVNDHRKTPGTMHTVAVRPPDPIIHGGM